MCNKVYVSPLVLILHITFIQNQVQRSKNILKFKICAYTYGVKNLSGILVDINTFVSTKYLKNSPKSPLSAALCYKTSFIVLLEISPDKK